MEDSAFKMKGFPQHVGVSPMRKDKSYVPHDRLVSGEGGSHTRSTKEKTTDEPKTKLGKWFKKHRVKDKLTNVKNKIEKFAGSDVGKAVAAGLTQRVMAPRPKKEVVAIIKGEQKSIM